MREITISGSKMIFLLAGFVFVSFATGSILPDNDSQVAVRDQKGKEIPFIPIMKF